MRNLIKRNLLLPISSSENFISRRESFSMFIIMRWRPYPFPIARTPFDMILYSTSKIFHISVIIKSSVVQKLMQTENGKWKIHQMNMSFKHRISVVFCRKYLISGSVRLLNSLNRNTSLGCERSRQHHHHQQQR